MRLAANLLFRAQETNPGRRTFAVASQLRASQWWPRERLQKLQLETSAASGPSGLSAYALLRGVMDDHRISPEDINSLDDVRRFPLLDKETVRARREDMVWRGDGRRLQLVRTTDRRTKRCNSMRTRTAKRRSTRREFEARVVESARVTGKCTSGARPSN